MSTLAALTVLALLGSTLPNRAMWWITGWLVCLFFWVGVFTV